MAKVVWSPPALRDVARIAAYIAVDNPAAAERELLAVRPYVVYEVTALDVVDILRVWHAAQDRMP